MLISTAVDLPSVRGDERHDLSAHAQISVNSSNTSRGAMPKANDCDSAQLVPIHSAFLQITISSVSRSRSCPTSKMSHDLRWRGSCDITIWTLLLHFEDSYDSTRRDGEGRWLWRLVSPFLQVCRVGQCAEYASSHSRSFAQGKSSRPFSQAAC
jgi:hypothetical protein